MDITVKVVKILEPQSGVSKKTGEMWKKFFFVGETTGNYPKKVAFSMFGEDRWKQAGIFLGGMFNVSFDPESREYKEKWFTELSAWKVVRIDESQTQQNAQAQAAVESPIPPVTDNYNGSSDDDVPF